MNEAAVLQPHNDYTDMRLRDLLGRRKHVTLKYSKSKSDINEAAVLQPHIGHTNMRQLNENGLSSDEDGYTGLSLVSVEFTIQVF